IQLSPEAAREWADWCRAHYAEQEVDGFPGSLEGPWGKLEAYTARLALILHLMDLAADPTRPARDAPPELPRRIMTDAARLVGYFKSHARRVYAVMGGKTSDGGDHVRALIGWIVRGELCEFSTRDIKRNFSRFEDDPAGLADALDWMIRRNLIRPRPSPEPAARPRGGRKAAASFEVNPSLRTSPRFRQFRRNPAL
ncbi:MAG: DUF3987 domain-containing protein, partial [Planctomycetia bacterium]|nr:DUF3987 domain-containing protein [Planctomycetia bacterium]